MAVGRLCNVSLHAAPRWATPCTAPSSRLREAFLPCTRPGVAQESRLDRWPPQSWLDAPFASNWTARHLCAGGVPVQEVCAFAAASAEGGRVLVWEGSFTTNGCPSLGVEPSRARPPRLSTGRCGLSDDARSHTSPKLQLRVPPHLRALRLVPSERRHLCSLLDRYCPFWLSAVNDVKTGATLAPEPTTRGYLRGKTREVCLLVFRRFLEVIWTCWLRNVGVAGKNRSIPKLLLPNE